MNLNSVSNLLNVEEAAQRLGVAKQTLYNWISARRSPKYIAIGRRRLFDPEDLQQFIDARRIDPEGNSHTV